MAVLSSAVVPFAKLNVTDFTVAIKFPFHVSDTVTLHDLRHAIGSKHTATCAHVALTGASRCRHCAILRQQLEILTVCDRSGVLLRDRRRRRALWATKTAWRAKYECSRGKRAARNGSR